MRQRALDSRGIRIAIPILAGLGSKRRAEGEAIAELSGSQEAEAARGGREAGEYEKQ